MPAVLVLVLGLVALAFSACGKSAHQTETVVGQAKDVAPLAAQGAVSLATRNTTRLGGASEATDAAAVARTVYPALTAASRPQAVVLVDERDWLGALAASALAGSPLGAPLLLGDASGLPAVTVQTLSALHPTGAPALGGAQVLRVGTAALPPAGYRTRSVAGADPAATAAAILALAPGLRASRQVIVVPAGAAPALQMPAAGLAAESGAPILFVGRSRVPGATATALRSMNRPAIYVVDPADVDGVALSELRALGTVSELTVPGAAAAGERVSENSIALARFTDGTFGWGVKEPGHGLVFANAARPLDAAAAAPLSATGDYGPLLVFEEAARIPPAMSTYLGDIQPAYTSAPGFRPVRGVYNHGWLIGDETAISAVVQAELDSLLQISPRKSTEEPSVAPAE
jgi:hypothetical protein